MILSYDAAQAHPSDHLGIGQMRDNLPHAPLAGLRDKVQFRARRSGHRDRHQFRAAAETLQ
jgi:hypothetical protein